MILTIEDTDIKYATVTNANFVTADEKEKKKQDRQKLKNGIADDSGKSKMERAFQYLSQSAMYYQINSQFDKAAKVLVRAGGACSVFACVCLRVCVCMCMCM